jgi:hypothetical protein
MHEGDATRFAVCYMSWSMRLHAAVDKEDVPSADVTVIDTVDKEQRDNSFDWKTKASFVYHEAQIHRIRQRKT